MAPPRVSVFAVTLTVELLLSVTAPEVVRLLVPTKPMLPAQTWAFVTAPLVVLSNEVPLAAYNEPVPRAEAFPTESVPLFRLTPLLKVLAPVKARIPMLAFVNEPLPVSTELTDRTFPETSTVRPLLVSAKLPPDTTPVPVEESVLPDVSDPVPVKASVPLFTLRLPESATALFVNATVPPLITKSWATVASESDNLPAPVLVSVPPVTVEVTVKSEPALTSTLFPAVARDRDPPEIMPPPLEVILRAAPKVSVPVEVTEPPFTASEPLSVVDPNESVPAFVTAPSVLPDGNVTEAPELMDNAFVPDKAVPNDNEPLPAETEPVKALSEDAFTARMPLVKRLPAPLNTPVKVPPLTVKRPELVTVPPFRLLTVA